MTWNERPILVVEDDENDVFFLKYAFETAEIPNEIIAVEDGQAAIDYLHGKGKFSDRKKYPLPALMLLDLKLPVRMGRDVLRWVQSQSHLHSLVTIVLSSSDDVRDIEECYRLGARSFLVKPVSVERRLTLARAIKTYWLELNQFCAISEDPR